MYSLRKWVKEKRYKNKDIAEMIGVTSSMVGFWLSRTHSPRLVHALKLRKLTKNRIKIENLLSFKDEKKLTKEQKND